MFIYIATQKILTNEVDDVMWKLRWINSFSPPTPKVWNIASQLFYHANSTTDEIKCGRESILMNSVTKSFLFRLKALLISQKKDKTTKSKV